MWGVLPCRTSAALRWDVVSAADLVVLSLQPPVSSSVLSSSFAPGRSARVRRTLLLFSGVHREWCPEFGVRHCRSEAFAN